MLRTAVEAAHAAGSLLMRKFGARSCITSTKGDISNVVTAVDLESERLILDRLRREFPDHGVIAEEAGHLAGSSAYTWAIDPLDGTSKTN